MLKLPTGRYTFEMERGPEYLVRGGHFSIENFADDTKQIDMKRFVDMSEHGWFSGDLDVRRPLADMELLMKADDLHLAQVVTWPRPNKTAPTAPRKDDPVVCFDGDRYYHPLAGLQSRVGTTLLYLNLPGPLKLPSAGGEYPPAVENVLAARQHANLWIDLSRPYWWDLPMLVALGQVDSIQIAHGNICRGSVVNNEADGKPRDKARYPTISGNARWSQDVYFKLLDCGLRIPPSAGSGSGESANPVGYNRMYVHVDGEFNYREWFRSLRAGRVVVTNGPLLRPRVQGQLPGYVFRAGKGKQVELEIALTLSTRKPISYLEIIKNGKVEHSVSLKDYAETGRLPKVRFTRSGWFLVRAVTDLPRTYRFAMTGPYYVEIDYRRRISKQAAQFFLDWVYERARQIKLADPAQRKAVLGHHLKARNFWREMVSKANAE